MLNENIIYILKLKKNKYYIGMTKNLAKRIDQHIKGNGSVWTKKFKPISIEKILRNANKFDEDKYVKIYMEKYGIYNVRGGSYSNLKLTIEQINSIKNELNVIMNNCFKCGKGGHYAKYCNNNKINMMNIKYECNYCLESFFSKNEALEHIEKICYPKNYEIKDYVIDNTNTD